MATTEAKNIEQRGAVFSAEELSFLLKHFKTKVEPQSPFDGVQKVKPETNGLQKLQKRRVLTNVWGQALKRIASIKDPVSVEIVGPESVAKSVFCPDRRKKYGGYLTNWPDENHCAVFFPCPESHILEMVGTELSAFDAAPPTLVDLSFSPAGLSVLAAALDFLRTLLFASMLERTPIVSIRIRKEDLEQQIFAGVGHNDKRWLVALLDTLMPKAFPVPPEEFERGIEELVSKGLFTESSAAPGSFEAHAVLFTIAFSLTSIVPAISLTRSDTQKRRHEQLIALRGNSIWHLSAVLNGTNAPEQIRLRSVDGLTSMQETLAALRGESIEAEQDAEAARARAAANPDDTGAQMAARDVENRVEQGRRRENETALNARDADQALRDQQSLTTPTDPTSPSRPTDDSSLRARPGSPTGVLGRDTNSLMEQRKSLKNNRNELSKRLGSDHPIVRGLDERIRQANEELARRQSDGSSDDANNLGSPSSGPGKPPVIQDPSPRQAEFDDRNRRIIEIEALRDQEVPGTEEHAKLTQLADNMRTELSRDVRNEVEGRSWDQDVQSTHRQAGYDPESDRWNVDVPDQLSQYRQPAPHEARAWHAKGLVAMRRGQYVAAIKAFTAAIKYSDEELPEYYRERANAYMERDEFEKALKDAEHAIHLEADNAANFLSRGGALIVLERAEESLDDIEKARELGADEAETDLLEGYAWHQLKRRRTALAFLERVRENCAEDGDYQLVLGDCYLYEQRYEEAHQAFSRSVELMPDNSVARALRGLTHFELSHFALAAKDAAEALALNSEEGLVFYVQGLLSDREDRIDRAVKFYDQALENAEELTGALLKRGYALLRLGRKDEACSDFERVLAIEDEGADVEEAQKALREMTA